MEEVIVDMAQEALTLISEMEKEDWHKVIKEIEDILGVDYRSENPLLCNLPNMIRDLKHQIGIREPKSLTGVWVEIPPLLKDGRCDGDCPMLNICKWNLLDIEGYYPVHEGCPNFKREPIIKDCNRNQCNNLCYLWRLCNGHVAGQVFCPYFKGEEE